MAQPDADAARTDTWALPAWEEYSEAAGSSFAGNWSDVEADVSLDTASSVASTEHQRVYRIQRARGGLPEDKQRDLRELHSLYTRRRLEESSQGAASVRSSVNWFQPAPCVSPRVQEQKPPTPVAKGNQVERELLAQQSEISAELQAVRRQLSDFQDKWKKTEEGKTQVEGETESSTAPTVASSWSSPVSANKGKKVVRDTVAIQTEIEEGEAAVKHWIRLLTEKLEELARKYSHEPTLNFQAAMTHLTALRSSSNAGGELSKENLESTSNSKGEQAVNSVPSLSSWHVGGAFKNAVPLDVAEQFLALEHAIARISIAVEQHERRQMTNFDQAVQQVQGYHHERMQQVVDESITELKMVRGRYKKKESQLEDELRAATKEVEQLKQTAAEAEHRKKLDRETMEFHLSSAKEQYDHTCRRYEDEIVQLKAQLETARAERKQVVSQHKDTHEVISQAKEGALALERQCQALKKQQERAKELHEREVRILQSTIRQLQKSNDDMELQHAKEKRDLEDTLSNLKSSQQAEKEELETRIKNDVEQQLMQELLPEKMSILEKSHEQAIHALQSEHKRQLEELTEQLNEIKTATPPSVHTVEIQTDPVLEEKESIAGNTDVENDNQAQTQIEELTRRCRALEKLLDKKFEDTSHSFSSSHQCDSCHTDDGVSTSSVLGGRYDLDVSRSSIRSDISIRQRASGKSKALARALLGSSRTSLNSVSLDNKTSPFMNETTLATDEATLGAHEMWDSASFTSMDTVDDLSSFASQRETPHQRMRSTQEILTLVRQIKQAAASPQKEPDPEVNWERLKQQHAVPTARNPPLSITKASGKAPTASLLSKGDPVTPGASVFDDLLC